ncbi:MULTISPECIES: DUF5916 domain-containing protein [unclassified Pseudoalteromonas]|uniref:DUF5916 domain-containing protein n=1 Tax=unclassified Pseudoalteromonas TaxID=194690 RepID=UPI002096CC0C|nr:DUF5916 domain-containing protein [Pseudoalteromonas sp. XMcav2-N]MCO7186804.1 DUF5916 domain-containing protein [Pseudoalteromonas sp. XMcav2-N]
MKQHYLTLCITAVLGSQSLWANEIYNTEVNLDGRLDEQQWQSAQQFKQFYQVVPATLTTHSDKLHAKAFSNAAGVYIGIVNFQGRASRQKQFNIQDAFMQAEFNRIVVDFAGDGSGAYEFAVTLGGGTQDAVLTPQLTKDGDWDGDWQSATFEADDYWSTEVFIPWHTVSFYNPAQGTESALGDIGVSIQLYDLGKNYIYSNQKQTTSNSDFYLGMPKLKSAIPNHSQLSFVPYFSHQQHFAEQAKNNSQSDVGFDLFYKPSHHQKLSVAVNPDFGQVDSDEVDINYSAVETLRSDKRPFFTQDIAVFSVQSLQDTKLIHTRRIGAGSDDGREFITPIDLATRFVHQGETMQVGAFAVKEDDLDSNAGKHFYAARAKYRQKYWQTGVLATHTERPWLDRQATTMAWDSQYQSATWSFQGALLASEVEQQQKQTGNGASLQLGYQFSPNTNLEGRYLKLNKSFDNSDLGYAQRNNWQYSEAKFSHAINTQSEWLARIKHSLTLSYEADNQGLKLPARQAYLSQWLLASGGQIDLHLDRVSGGWQDNLGRQSQAFEVPGNWETRVMYVSPYIGKFSWAASFEYDQEGFDGRAQQYAIDMTWLPHPNWTLKFNNFYRTGDGWLVASDTDQVTQYQRDFFVNKIQVSGLITDKLEFSSTLEWAVLEARSDDVYSIQAHHRHRLNNVDTSFEDRRLSSQFKLRYRMGALSDVFLVYRRGGAVGESVPGSQIGSEPWLERAKQLWQSPSQDSVLLKVRYKF